MSVTTNAQSLSEVAQAGEANACCLALGSQYTIITNPVTGEELCALQGGMFDNTTANTFPLANACQVAQAESIQSASPEQESAGSGFVAGFTNIIDALGSATTSVLGALNPQQPQTQAPTQGQYVVPAQSNKGKQLIAIAVFVLVVAVVVIMLRRKK